MPKLKPSPIKAASEIVQQNIKARGAYFNCRTERDFAAKFGMSQSTYHDKSTEPRKWKLEELVMVAMALKVPLSWLMIDHSGEIKEG